MKDISEYNLSGLDLTMQFEFRKQYDLIQNASQEQLIELYLNAVLTNMLYRKTAKEVLKFDINCLD